MNISKTETGIYYLHDYIPRRNFHLYEDDEIAISKMIWDYKNGDNNALDKFTIELMQAIAEISQNMKSKKIGLVAVPPSKTNKLSAVRTSIERINDWYRQEIIRKKFGCYKKIYDYGDLIMRSSDISTAHEGRRATYEEQMESLACTKTKLSKLWTTFIILDDVTTCGTSMDACRDVLIQNGAKKKYIYRMAIARTRWEQM